MGSVTLGRRNLLARCAFSISRITKGTEKGSLASQQDHGMLLLMLRIGYA